MKRNLNRRRFRMALAPPGSRRARIVHGLFRAVAAFKPARLRNAVRQWLPSPLRRRARQLRQHWRLWDPAYRQYLEGLRSQVVSLQESHPEAKVTLLFPPSLDWDVQLFQRPQQLALALAEQGALVFYLLHTPSAQGPAFERVTERLYLCRAPLDAFDRLENPWVYLLTWNLDLADGFIAPRVIYDYVDEIDAFEGVSPAMRHAHARMLLQAQHVLVTALPLYEQVVRLRPDALLCPNGVDAAAFNQAQVPPDAPPQDIQPVLAEGKPVVGYYGALARWFDYDLLAALAQQRQDLSFVLIGPDYDSTLPPALLDLRNICWLGVKPYRLLPAYLHYFDVAVIPFCLNAITHATSPLKLFEYMAGGKPVVITPMQESLRYPGVLAASGADEFSYQIDQALHLRKDPEYQALLARVVEGNTWQCRGRQIMAALGPDLV